MIEEVILFLGADPGISGAIVALDQHGKYYSHIRGDGTGTDMWKMLYDEWCCDEGTMCFGLIERVSSMPAQGVSSTFKFGVSYGFLQGMFIAAGIRHEFISPVKWQTVMKCRTGGDKNITKAMAQRLFPSVKVTHRIADALLIAELARRMALERGL